MRCDASGPRSEAISASSISSSVEVSSAARLVRPVRLSRDPLGGLAEAAAQAIEPAHAQTAVKHDRRWRDHDARLAAVAALCAGDRDGREIVGVALAVVFDQHRLDRADEAVEPAVATAARRLRGGGRRAPSRPRAAAAACARRACPAAAKKGRRERRRCRNLRSISACSAPFLQFRSEIRRSGRRRSWRPARAALMRSTVRTASARLWRRFIRLRIMSSPACSDRWKCGISRGSPAISSNSASSISMLSSDDRRRRAGAARRRAGAGRAGRGRPHNR